MLSKYKKVPLAGIANKYLKILTTKHRIQGSRGLEEAIDIIAEFLRREGFRIKVFEIPTSSEKGFVETPISWDVKDGFLELKAGENTIAYLSYHDHPTLVAAHSPPGEGCGEVRYCESLEGCSGEVVLLEAPAYIAYNTVDADLVILYDSKRYPDAVPYTGLFLRAGEVREKPVVLNIPYAYAQRLISMLSRGVRITACWKVVVEYSNRPLKGLIAYNSEEPGIAFISHICHPRPSAHDNASGVVANTLVAKILSETGHEFSSAHVFVPEYTGTVYLKEYLPWHPIGVVNLDMVGSKQSVTGSVLNIVNPPLFMKPYMASYTYLAIKLLLDKASSFGGFSLPAQKYSITPYTVGSDHDVTVSWGIDSVMLNEWPSKYYHTDMDDVESISISYLVDTSVASALAGYMAYKKTHGENITEFYRSYLKSWYQFEACKKEVGTEWISKLLSYWDEYAIKVQLETPISSRYIYKLIGLPKYMKLRNIKGALTYLSVYAPLAYINGIENHEEMFQQENLIRWTQEEKELISEAWSIIKEKLG